MNKWFNFKRKMECKWSWFVYRLKNPKRKQYRPITDLGYSLEHYFVQENKDKLDELVKTTCEYEEKEINGQSVFVISYASNEYRKFYNTNIVDKTIKLLKDVQIEKYKYKKGKYLKLWGDRLGLIIGEKGKIIDYLQNDMGIKIKLFSSKSNTIYGQIEGLYYSYWVNNWEELL